MSITFQQPNKWITTYTYPLNYVKEVKVKQDLGTAFKAKKCGINKAHVVFILDSSGSMYNHYDKTISGFNEFLQTQQNSEVETLVSLYTFSGNEVKQIYKEVPAKEADYLSPTKYNVNGLTNLNDAIGSVIERVNLDLAKFPKTERSSVVIVILTDGDENSSKTFAATDVKTMVKKCEKANWGFIYMGASLDTFTTASVKYGFSRNTTMLYDTSNIDSGFVAAGRSAAVMNSAFVASEGRVSKVASYATTGFTDDERTKAG